MNGLVLYRLNSLTLRAAISKAILYYLYLNPRRGIYRPYYSPRNASPVYFRTSSIYITQLQLLPPLTIPLLTIALLQPVLIISRFIANYTTLLGLQNLSLELYLNILSFTFITPPTLLISVYRLIRSLMRRFCGVLLICYIRLVILLLPYTKPLQNSFRRRRKLYLLCYRLF